ncbi:MAG: hypothetical protein H6729_14075 [Deltaproteobacteria bacterium]|nr:hypothetical protein [Deltaproteobacteria bacterium]
MAGTGSKGPRRNRLLESETARSNRDKSHAPRTIQEILGLGGAGPGPGAGGGVEGEGLSGASSQAAPIYARDDLIRFVSGQITLGDLQGITKDEQYQMAEVGYNCLRLARYDDARTVFEGLMALDPFDAYFQTALGTIAHQTGDFALADTRYSRALEINPFSGTARASRGELRFIRGDAVSALADLMRSVKDDADGKEPATVRARAIVESLKRALSIEGEGGDEALSAKIAAEPESAVEIVRQLLGVGPVEQRDDEAGGTGSKSSTASTPGLEPADQVAARRGSAGPSTGSTHPNAAAGVNAGADAGVGSSPRRSPRARARPRPRPRNRPSGGPRKG